MCKAVKHMLCLSSFRVDDSPCSGPQNLDDLCWQTSSSSYSWKTLDHDWAAACMEKMYATTAFSKVTQHLYSCVSGHLHATIIVFLTDMMKHTESKRPGTSCSVTTLFFSHQSNSYLPLKKRSYSHRNLDVSSPSHSKFQSGLSIISLMTNKHYVAMERTLHGLPRYVYILLTRPSVDYNAMGKVTLICTFYFSCSVTLGYNYLNI